MKIEIKDPGTIAFYKGVGVGTDLAARIDADVPAGTPFEQRLAWYWLYAGAAAVEKDITNETMMRYVEGAAMRAPTRQHQFVLTLDIPETEDEDAGTAITMELAHQLRVVRQSLLDSEYSMKDSVYGIRFTGDQNKKIGEWEIHE